MKSLWKNFLVKDASSSSTPMQKTSTLIKNNDTKCKLLSVITENLNNYYSYTN